MRFLILNRYDPKNPRAGGSEVYTGELAKRLVRASHEVIWFSSRTNGTLAKQSWEGINIVRAGNILTVIYQAYKFFLSKKNEFDFVIDEVHAYPFFTRFYVPAEKRLVLVHEVTGKIWYYMTIFPLSLIGDALERLMFRFFYNKEKTITVSKSTRRELVRYGVVESKITIVPVGLSLEGTDSKITKSKYPQIIYFGGMRPLKQVEDQIKAISILKQEFPYLKLYILGRRKGSYYKKLVRLVKRLHLNEMVVFTGYLTDEEKEKLIQSSWLTVNTSVKEGWGLAVSEANAYGLPAVVYKTAGNVDAVRHLETGLHTIDNNPDMLAKAIKRIITDEKFREKLGRRAKQFVKLLDWDKSFAKFMKILNG